MDAVFSLVSPLTLVLAMIITGSGGFVKGAIGFAMPLIMVSGLAILMEPQLVIAGMIVPILLTNVYQVLRAGLIKSRDALLEHWRYVLMVCMMIFISAQFLTVIPSDLLYVMLGVVVVGLSAVQLAGLRPVIAPHMRRPVEWISGALAGTLGGLAGTWGPPTALYLLALETPRNKSMAVQGVIYGLGSVMLFLGHLRSGVLNTDTWPLSIALVAPALLGMWIGARSGDRFDQDKFRKITLLVLVIAGLNLIRRGLMG